MRLPLLRAILRSSLREARGTRRVALCSSERRHAAAALVLAIALAYPCRASGSSGASDGEWRLLQPTQAFGHSAIYDPIRNRVLVFGGLIESPEDFSDATWELSLAATPTWKALATQGPTPEARHSHTAVHDPLRNRMIVFGGGDAETWQLTLADPPTWSQLVVAGTPPQARSAHSAIYDPIRDRVLVFGGWLVGDVFNVFNDIWALDLSGTLTWAELAPDGPLPSPRQRHTAIYDPTLDRMIVFGGSDANGTELDEVWALSLGGTLAWAQLSPGGTPPPARAYHAAVHDPASNRMLVFGGSDGSVTDDLLDDLWALSLDEPVQWASISPPEAPPDARFGHAAVYDPVGDRMLVLSGGFATTPPFDTWELTLDGEEHWSALPPGVGPSPAADYVSIYDPPRERLIVLVRSAPIEVWSLSLAGTPGWTRLLPTGGPPPDRRAQSAIFDPVRDRLVMFGGQDIVTSSPLGDVWTLSLTGTPEWSEIIVDAPGDPTRTDHTAIYDPIRDRMVVFGGFNGTSYLRNVWVLSLAGEPTWTQLAPTGTKPLARAEHAAIYDPGGDRMIVFAGRNATPGLNDTWALSLDGTTSWARIATSGWGFVGVWDHSAIHDPLRDRMVIFGGSVNTGAQRDETWALPLDGPPHWVRLFPSGPLPAGRGQHNALHDPLGDRMIVLGGGPNDLWTLAWSGATGVGASSGSPLLGATLAAPRPNPFVAAASVRISLEAGGRARLDIFDVAGRRVRGLLDAVLPAGSREVVWRGDDCAGNPAPPGVYFVRLAVDGGNITRKVVRY